MLSTDKSDKFDDIIKRLDVIVTFLLAQKGISQQDIAKILGISNHKLQDIFGKNYTKIQPKNVQKDDKKKSNKMIQKKNETIEQ